MGRNSPRNLTQCPLLARCSTKYSFGCLPSTEAFALVCSDWATGGRCVKSRWIVKTGVKPLYHYMEEKRQSVASQSESCLYLGASRTLLPFHLWLPHADPESFIFMDNHAVMITLSRELNLNSDAFILSHYLSSWCTWLGLIYIVLHCGCARTPHSKHFRKKKKKGQRKRDVFE